ncbi:MAG TPA: lipid-A-disaccharide synthase, partial [Planctomycetaceae bacterium]|nr:lipid-A-disaccharide synthase [Planctomycetaceae bacterium]
ELRRRLPGLECSGFGGPLMEAAGCRLLYTLTNLAVMGLAPVIPKIPQFFQLVRRAKTSFEQQRPDAVVLVDFPGFNWWIARAAKKLGIPVFYYLPPQLWAWAPWRVRRMRKFVDCVLCCLPFETEWYRERGVPAQFVGHPFFDEVAERPLDGEFLATHSCPSTDAAKVPTVAVLPGSRGHEVSQNFPIQLRVMKRLHRRLPGVRFLVASYNEAQRDMCRRLVAERAPDLPISLHVGKTSEIIELAEVCLMVSGSVSLEVLARKTPAVVVYRMSPGLYWFLRLMVTCRYFSLPNLIADHPVMPEFAPINELRATIAAMTDILHRWLADETEYVRQKATLAKLCDDFATAGATRNAASAILERIEAGAGSEFGGQVIQRGPHFKKPIGFPFSS